MNRFSESQKNPVISNSPASIIAFKEWASVVEALAKGEQILILRKGGIHEKGKKFNVLHDSFLLFPTYEHQNAEDLNPRGQELLKDVTVRHAAENPADLKIGHFATVTESLRIDDFEKLRKLSGFHVWSENALRKRFEWGEEKGIYVLIVRVYRLPSQATLPNLPAYGGCRSWVDLSASIPLAGIHPVLSEEAFLSKQNDLKRVLAL